MSLRDAGEFWGGTGSTEELIAELGREDRVELRPGYVTATEVPDLFTDVDALALPYRSATATLNAFLAFEHGVPVIGTRVGTMEQDVEDGVIGVLCAPDDVASLADALHRFDAENEPLRLRRGSARSTPDPAGSRTARPCVRSRQPGGAVAGSSRATNPGMDGLKPQQTPLLRGLHWRWGVPLRSQRSCRVRRLHGNDGGPRMGNQRLKVA